MPTRSPPMPYPANSACDPSGSGTMYGSCCATARNQSTSEVTAVAKMAKVSDVMPSHPKVSVPAANSAAKSAVQPVLQVAMVT
jgi:hypothetical protein